MKKVDEIFMKKQHYLYWGEIPNKPGTKRPYLVLSVDQANANQIIVAPVVSSKPLYITSIPLSKEDYPLKKDSSIELSQVTTIDSKYLNGEICELKCEETKMVKESLRLLFSL